MRRYSHSIQGHLQRRDQLYHPQDDGVTTKYRASCEWSARARKTCRRIETRTILESFAAVDPATLSGEKINPEARLQYRRATPEETKSKIGVSSLIE